MLDAYRDLIDELLGTPTELRRLVADHGAVEASPQARQLIAEIRRRDRAVLDHVQQITHHEMPYLRAIAAAPADGEDDLTALLAEMEAARGDLVSLLINLSLKDWERGAIHETAGEITLADEIEEHVEFDEAQRRAFRALASAS